MGGLIRTAPAPIRDLDMGFYGAGCPHVSIECFVQQINKLIMHYGCKSNNGLSMKVSLEYMILELGISGQPFQESYVKYEQRVTHCWLKSIWEKCSKFDVLAEVGDVPIELPRLGEHWLIKIFEQLGYSTQDLARLNRV